MTAAILQPEVLPGSGYSAKSAVPRPTVSVYLRQLEAAGDIIMDDIHLAEQGRAVAKVRRYKYSVLYGFLRSLGVSEAAANADACAMEHNLSAESFKTIE